MKDNLIKTAAAWVSGKAGKVSARSWLLGLLVFCMIGGGVSGYLLRGAMGSSFKLLFRVQPITLPRFINGEKPGHQLDKVRLWADSIRNSFSAKKDSIIETQ
jgi:hypothetical protein